MDTQKSQTQPFEQVERNQKIIGCWNNGDSLPMIVKRLPEYNLTTGAVSGVIFRAKKRGVKINNHIGFARPRDKSKATLKNAFRGRRMDTPHTGEGLPKSVIPVSSSSELNRRLRQVRRERTAQELCSYLPTHPKQCRWLEGDYLDGGLCACPHDRKNVDVPLGGDTFPYCAEHLDRALDKSKRQKRQFIINPRYHISYSVSS